MSESRNNGQAKWEKEGLTPKLIAACRRNDRNAWRRFFVLTENIVVMHLEGMKVDRNDLQGACWAILQKAYKKLHTLKEVPAFHSWLKRIVEHTVLDLGKRAGHQEKGCPSIDDANGESLAQRLASKVLPPDIALQEKERIRALEVITPILNECVEMLGARNPRGLRAIRLFYVQNLSLEAIAEKLRSYVSRVSTLLKKAMAKLRHLFYQAIASKQRTVAMVDLRGMFL